MPDETYPVTNCTAPTCGAEVVFRQATKKDGTLGKNSPYDYPPGPCSGCGGSGDFCLRCHGEKVEWISHFATCVEAPRFRRGPRR